MGFDRSKENSCCFTGHRSSKLPWKGNDGDIRCVALKNRLYDIAEALYRAGITHYICGMATGCDMYFCEAVLKLRSEHPEITLEAAIPCEDQTKLWDLRQRKLYNHYLHQCDFQTVIQREYTDGCMQKRNFYMVDNSSVLVAVFDGTYGGTMQTIAYAVKKGLEIIEIRP